MALPIVAVIAAGGKQGASVVDHLYKEYSNKYAIRAIVRNPAKYSPPSDSIEVVQGDYSSLENLLPALAGASIVFAYTVPDFEVKGLEAQWSRNIGDAVKATPSVTLLIYSSIPDAHAISGGTLRCYNYEGKVFAEKYIKGLGLPGVVFFWPACFMENFLTWSKPKPDAEGVYVFEGPVRQDLLLGYIDVDKDTGRFVAAVLDDPEKYKGKSVKLPGEWMTFPELARRWSAATGKKARYQRVSYEEYANQFSSFGQGFVDIIREMYMYVNLYGCYGGEVEDPTGPLPFTPGSWEDFARKHWGVETPLKPTTMPFKM